MADHSLEVKEVLRDNGCFVVRQSNGDYEMWQSNISMRRFPIDDKILSRHTANGILKHAGLPPKPF